MTDDTFPPCDCCGDPTEEGRCEHGDRLCLECTADGACVLCEREAIEERDHDIALGFAIEDRWEWSA